MHEAERKLLGDAVFVKGLRRYVDTYRFRWARDDCLNQTIAKESPKHAAELARLRRHWWLEAHGDENLGSLDAMAGSLSNQPVDPALLKQVQEMWQQLGD